MSMQSDFIKSLKITFKGLRKKTRKIPKEAHDDLKEVLARLKQREKDLLLKLDAEQDNEKIKSIKNEINIIHRQREKGLQLLKDIHGGEE